MNMPFLNKPRTASLFELHRVEDISGISGKGHILDGVVFPDGTTVIRWKSKNSSTAVFKTYRQFEKVHVAYHGESQIKWVDGFDGVGFTLNYLRNIQATMADEEKRAASNQKFPYAKIKQILSTKIAELGRFKNEDGTNTAVALQARGKSQNSLSRISSSTESNESPQPGNPSEPTDKNTEQIQPVIYGASN